MVGGGTLAAVLLLPNRSGNVRQHFTATPPQLVTSARQVPVRARDRRAIDRLLDRFVADAVARRDPAAAYGLATPALRSGASRADWARGNLPVEPLAVRDTTFRGWVPSFSYRDEIGFDLLVHARPGSSPGAIAYAVDVKRVHRRWLVDSFVPRALYAPAGKTPRITSHLDYGPGSVANPTERHHSAAWFAVPLALFAIPGLCLAGVLLVRRRRNRIAERRYRAASA